MNELIKRAGELGTCYVSTGMISDLRFDIDTVDKTETELILGNLDDSEIRIPLHMEMRQSGDCFEGDGIKIEFKENI